MIISKKITNIQHKYKHNIYYYYYKLFKMSAYVFRFQHIHFYN